MVLPVGDVVEMNEYLQVNVYEPPPIDEHPHMAIYEPPPMSYIYENMTVARAMDQGQQSMHSYVNNKPQGCLVSKGLA